MPEGPEVLQISTSLNKLLKNKTLLEINIIENSQYAKKSPNNYDVFIKNLPLKVEYIKCRGKFIYWLFSNNTVMLNHLKMTGFWSVEKKEKHSTLEFIFKEKNLKLYYTDVRRFGRLEFGKNFSDIKSIFDKLGPDVLNDSSFNFNTFKKIAEKKKRTNITRFLMDQENLSGIGNYLKAEILYASKISPHRTVGHLEEKELKTLYENVKKIPKLSYHWKGMSKSDYKDIDGKKGDFERFLKVYCQTKDHLGNKIKSEKTKDGRTTYWVPDVQI